MCESYKYGRGLASKEAIRFSFRSVYWPSSNAHTAPLTAEITVQAHKVELNAIVCEVQTFETHL